MHLFKFFPLVFFATACFSFFWSASPCDKQPALNKQIVAFVKSNINKQVGSGECWDLASEALNKAGAQWDHAFEFGKVVNAETECVYPGDIIQLEEIELEYREKNTIFKESFAQHTAIIYQVKKKGSFVLAQQNTDTHGRKVGLDPFDLSHIVKGKYTVFRPTH